MNACCVEGVDILRFVMGDGVVAKGFEVVLGSEEALGNHRGVENNTVDSVIQSEAAVANNMFIGGWRRNVQCTGQ